MTDPPLAFFYKEPSSRPSCKSSLLSDLQLSNCSSKIPEQFLNFHSTSTAIQMVQTQANIEVLNFAFNFGFWLLLNTNEK